MNVDDPVARWAASLDWLLQYECAPVYELFNQSTVWPNRDKQQLQIADMDPVYRYVVAQHLLRRARRYATRYSIGEAMAGKATVELIDSRHDAEGWVRTTPLYNALAANWPPGVALFARHHSTCNVRTRMDLYQICACHRAGCGFINGRDCTCREGAHRG